MQPTEIITDLIRQDSSSSTESSSPRLFSGLSSPVIFRGRSTTLSLSPFESKQRDMINMLNKLAPLNIDKISQTFVALIDSEESVQLAVDIIIGKLLKMSMTDSYTAETTELCDSAIVKRAKGLLRERDFPQNYSKLFAKFCRLIKVKLHEVYIIDTEKEEDEEEWKVKLKDASKYFLNVLMDKCSEYFDFVKKEEELKKIDENSNMDIRENELNEYNKKYNRIVVFISCLYNEKHTKLVTASEKEQHENIDTEIVSTIASHIIIKFIRQLLDSNTLDQAIDETNIKLGLLMFLYAGEGLKEFHDSNKATSKQKESFQYLTDKIAVIRSISKNKQLLLNIDSLLHLHNSNWIL